MEAAQLGMSGLKVSPVSKAMQAIRESTSIPILVPICFTLALRLSDVERHYYNKLGFEATVESLRNEVNELYEEEARLRNELLSLPQVAPKLE